MNARARARARGRGRGRGRARGRGRSLAIFAFGVLAALPAAIYIWSFMVDDALIIARYAHHLASGIGYRFNRNAAPSDGVTPIGFAFFLLPFARGGVLSAFVAAKILGLLCWLLASGVLALAIDSLGQHRCRFAAMLLVGTSAPLAAWSVAGLETGVVQSLATLAVAARVLRCERLTIVTAAWVAAWRPEAIPWALVLSLAPPRDPTALQAKPPMRATGFAVRPGVWIVVAAVCLVAAIRWISFGHAEPLAAIAKPPVLDHGAKYALACMLLCGVVAAVPLQRVPIWIAGLVAAVAAHYVALVLVGGDWMPLSRLAVVCIPTSVIVAAYLIDEANTPIRRYGPLALALTAQLWVFSRIGPRAANVGPARMSLIDEVRAPLGKQRVVAAVDIGWIGAATDATIVDLAGVTDPAVAVLGGGHTSKQISRSLLGARQVDALVFRLADGQRAATPWTESRFAYRSEALIARMPAMDRSYRLAASIGDKIRYMVLVANPPATVLSVR